VCVYVCVCFYVLSKTGSEFLFFASPILPLQEGLHLSVSAFRHVYVSSIAEGHFFAIVKFFYVCVYIYKKNIRYTYKIEHGLLWFA